MWDQRVERSFRSVGSDMQLVEDTALECLTFPVIIDPAKGVQVYDLRWTMHALRLISRRRVG